MADIKKYNEIYDQIKLLKPEDIKQLIDDAKNTDEKEFYELIGGFLQEHKKEDDEKLRLVADILDNNRLTYHFQPIVEAVSGEIVAYEALMRADTKEHVSPLEILKYAEQLGRLHDVEKATFDNILTYLEENQDKFADKRVFINSIPGVFIPDDCADEIRARIKALNKKIVVEFTEQAEVNDDVLNFTKEKIEALGVDIAIDDYGTGYSNVYNLLRYMPDIVKIDRMLLSDIHLNAQKQHIVKEIIQFAHNNNIKVLAEGVETGDELKMVTTLGIDLIQGYYTARPQAEIIHKIDDIVQTEIVEYGQLVAERNLRETYEAGDAVNIPLVKLISLHYTRIKFTKDKVNDKTVVVSGRQGFKANVDIEFEDGYSGRIELNNAYLDVRNELPTIKLGENCNVTIVLTGENVIEQGGILVPESSRLKIEGDGNLRLKRIAINGYGIGNDRDSKCGTLIFEQDGLIEIQGNTMHAVGIGAGYGGNISVNRGLYSIQFAGEDAVGIGSLYSDINLVVTMCGIELHMRNSNAVGIGSLTGNVELFMARAGINGFFSASRCACIGTIDGKTFKYKLSHSTGELNAHATYLCGIGNISGDADLSMDNFSFKITMDGDNAAAMGNLSETAHICSNNGDMLVNVTNKLNYDIGAKDFELIGGFSEFKHNGETVERKAI